GSMYNVIRKEYVLYWCFTEWPSETIEKCLQVCVDRYYKPKGSQPQYSLLARQIEEKVLPLCIRAGIGQVVWSPLAQGVLTGKYKPGQPPPPGSRATDEKQNMFMNRF